MSSLPRKRRRSGIAGAGTAALAVTLLLPVTASAATSELAPTSTGKAPLSARLAHATGPVTVMVELGGASATQAFADNRARGASAARKASREAAAQAAPEVANLAKRFSERSTRAKVLFSTTRVFPGVAVTTDASKLDAIASLPGVVRVLPLTPKTRSNARSDEVTHAIDVWHDLGNTGKGVTIAVLDTGIDYTHSDFAGGGLADFTRNDRTHIPSDGPQYANDVAFPTDKVVSGFDFAGDAYDGTNTPAPDSDPGDCASALGGGHGTHVSGTAAGFGVNANGTTFRGNYATLGAAGAAALNVGPGAAPDAKLSALRVFGCNGSTTLVTTALDYIARLNTDDNPANDIQIANLSLGSDFTRGDDPDAQAIDAITQLGVLPVIAAGNAGDLYGATGSPGTAQRALTVAATDDGVDTVDGVKVSVGGTATIYPATNSIAYPYRSKPADNTGSLVKLTDPANLDGCVAFSPADKAAVAGKYAFLEWDDVDATRRCGSVKRSGNAAAAGALGSVFGSSALRFSAGITGSSVIPVTLVNKTGADAIRTALVAGTPVTATFGFNFRAGTPQGAKIIDLPSTDKIASFTSRGGTPADGFLKPDVGAPGLHTFSANSGTGNEGLDESGTSMATPHTAGNAALVKSAHPAYTPEEVKAALVNTASGVLTTDGQGKGIEYGVGRVGAGRIDGFDAVGSSVLAFVQDGSGSVGLGFGPVAATDGLSRKKIVRVENFGERPVRYRLSYASAEDVPGVTFEVPRRITVPAARRGGPGVANFTVTMRVSDVAALRKTPDPTVELNQLGLPRDFVAEENGRILMTPAAGRTLRLPAAVAVRPASEMHAPEHLGSTTRTPGSSTLSTGAVKLAGTPVANGPLGQPDSVNSLIGGFQLQASSPELAPCAATQLNLCLHFPSQRAGDLQYVGATSTGADPTKDVVGIALTTFGSWISPAFNPTARGVSGEIAAVVTIDTNGDGKPDREIDVTRISANTDIDVAETFDLATGDVVDDQFLNGVPGSTDSNVFNSNAMVLPVSVKALGLPAGSTTISYTVQTISLDDLGSTLDTVGPLSFDVAHPTVKVTSPSLPAAAGVDGPSLLSLDVPGRLGITRDSTATATPDLGLLLLHLHNSDDDKAEIVETDGRVKGPERN